MHYFSNPKTSEPLFKHITEKLTQIRPKSTIGSLNNAKGELESDDKQALEGFYHLMKKLIAKFIKSSYNLFLQENTTDVMKACKGIVDASFHAFLLKLNSKTRTSLTTIPETAFSSALENTVSQVLYEKAEELFLLGFKVNVNRESEKISLELLKISNSSHCFSEFFSSLGQALPLESAKDWIEHTKKDSSYFIIIQATEKMVERLESTSRGLKEESKV